MESVDTSVSSIDSALTAPIARIARSNTAKMTEYFFSFIIKNLVSNSRLFYNFKNSIFNKVIILTLLIK